MRMVGVAILCFALAGCQAKKSASLHIDPALESLVPADTVFVAGANLDAIRGTSVYEKLLAKAPLPQLEEFTRRTGLDPRKDLAQILACWDGKHGVFLARGKFQMADLEAHLKSNGAPQFGYKNYKLFGNEQAAIVLLNDSTVAAGPAGELRSILDRQGNRGLPPALADLLRTLPASDQIYAALSGGLEELISQLPQNGNLANFRSVDSATLGLDLKNGIQAVARMNSKSESDAKFIHDMLRGLIGFARLRTPDNQPDLLKLYDAINVTQQQTQTQVTADIPADQVDRFLDLLPKR